ncbi:MAG: hypothetical protein FWD82_03825, partial [Defluviitaleaceae bacterium]|nr:hypothetical protein [Defluviitaleaceae bacterium]
MLTFLVIIPILIAVFLFAFHLKKTVRIIAMLAQAAFVAFAFNLFLTTRYEPRTTFVGNYYGTLGIILRADNLAAIFILLTTVIFLVVGFYSLNERNSRTFWFLLFVLEASLIGLFLSQDFFNVFVLVEVGTVVATVLLMYDRKRRDNFSGMLFLMVNIVAMQFYLLGLGYIYKITGALDMNVAAQVLRETDTQQLILPYALIMTSIAVKCSLLPTLTWLPKVNSMTGARSSIAAIMSGLQIKGGIYLFIRMHSIFDEFVSQTIASELFLIIGIITAISGIILALSQTNIKLILAYSTIAQVG